MKLEKVTLKQKGWILEEIEDANKPTKVEPEKLEPIDLGDPEAIAKREEQIKKIIAKRLEANKKVAEETKGEDHAILSKDIKVKEELCKNRKEVGALVEKLKTQGIKPFVKKVNEGENRYKVFYKPLKESDCDNIDIEALEWYVKNYSEGDNITVTADLLNVLEQSLEMYKKHCGKGIKEDWEDDKASIQRAKDYWANEVYFQLENIEDLSQDERILNASEEQIKEMAYDIAQEIIDDEHLWSEINETIEWYIYHHDYMLANRKDESINESDVKVEAKKEIKEGVKVDIEAKAEELRDSCKDMTKDELLAQASNEHKFALGCKSQEEATMHEVNADAYRLLANEIDESCKQEEIKKPENKKIANPRKQIKEAESYKGPFEIEYWVDEEARDMGFGDIYLERFDDLEEAKAVADDLFGEVASVEVLDANGEVVYGRYPEDEGCSKKTIKEDVEVARVEYCVMDELDNNIECFDNSEDAINFALENEGVRVLEVSYGPENDFGDEPELGCEEIWSIREDLHEGESLKEETKPICHNCGVELGMEKYTNPKTGEVLCADCFARLDDEEVEESKKEKKFAKKVVQPGVQMDDDDMSSPVAFNEAEAHALIGDKPIVEDQKSQIEMANDFSNTMMNSDALKALEDDDNI